MSTGHISPQFHVVFDDHFSTIHSIIIDETPPSFWNEFNLENYTHKIPLDKNAHITLQDEWLNPSDLEERARSFARSNEIRKTISSNKSNIYDRPHPSTSNRPSEESSSISSK